ncbi:biotin transporter BioY [Mariniluteicoccus flavus]
MTSPRRFTATDLALVAVFAALIAALSLVPGFDIGPVPITLQTLGVALAGLCLGPLRGFLATSLYLLVGFAGLPVFAKFSAGVGVLAKPSAGYLLAFPIAAAIAGALAVVLLRRFGLKYVSLFVAGVAASIIIIHPLGIAGLMVNAHLPFAKAFTVDMGFWIGDVLKNLAAAAVAMSVHKAFPALLLGGVRRDESADEPVRAAGVA